MKVLVVDDERVARSRLRRMLAKLDGVEVVGEAGDGESALEQVAELTPDVVLLDIRMPGVDGIETARRLAGKTDVVFTTAYDEYAVQAFETAAVDYLLKPIAPGRLESAIDRVRRRRESSAPSQPIEELLDRLAERREPPRVTARRGDTIRVFDAREISRFHAQDRYVVFRQDGSDYLLDDSLAALEKRLGPWGFLRVHRGELVNLDRVRAFRRVDDVSFVELVDGERAAVSRRHSKTLKTRLGIPVK